MAETTYVEPYNVNKFAPTMACFLPGTLIHTQDGPRLIEEIRAGDVVAAKHQANPDSPLHWRKVIETYQHADKAVLQLKIRHVSGAEESLFSTTEHPFFVLGAGWRKTAELRSGDQLPTVDGSFATLFAVEALVGLHGVHNFAVEEDHTYFVGAMGIWVHNEYGVHSAEQNVAVTSEDEAPLSSDYFDPTAEGRQASAYFVGESGYDPTENGRQLSTRLGVEINATGLPKVKATFASLNRQIKASHDLYANIELLDKMNEVIGQYEKSDFYNENGGNSALELFNRLGAGVVDSQRPADANGATKPTSNTTTISVMTQSQAGPSSLNKASQSARPSKSDFVKMVYAAALAEEARTGVPAGITAAQAILETGYGRSVPKDIDTGKYSYNLFGIKAHGSPDYVTVWTHEEVNGERIKIKDKFMAYEDFEGSIKGRTTFFEKNRRYASLFKSNDSREWAVILQKKGYATDSNYAKKLISIMDMWELK